MTGSRATCKGSEKTPRGRCHGDEARMRSSQCERLGASHSRWREASAKALGLERMATARAEGGRGYPASQMWLAWLTWKLLVMHLSTANSHWGIKHVRNVFYCSFKVVSICLAGWCSCLEHFSIHQKVFGL